MSQSLQKMDLTLPIGSLESYIYRVNQIPLLTAEQEVDLARRFRDHEDLAAARELVLSHLRFVVSIARGYSGYGLAQADLIQEGNIGLMKAVKRFDPEMGVRLVSFAVHWVKAEMHEFILRNWRIVKVATTKAQRKLFFNLRKASKRLGWFSNEEVHNIAQALKVTPEEVWQMEARLNAHDESFDMSSDDDDDSNRSSPSEYLEDHRYNPSRQLEAQNWSDSREQNLSNALTTLDERSQQILQRRWLASDKATLHELAAEYGVSAERIRQLEKNAMEKLKKAMVQH